MQDPVEKGRLRGDPARGCEFEDTVVEIQDLSWRKKSIPHPPGAAGRGEG